MKYVVTDEDVERGFKSAIAIADIATDKRAIRAALTACREAFDNWFDDNMPSTDPDVAAWEAWQAAWNTRAQASAPEGEPVAWQYRNVNSEGRSPFWHDCTQEAFEKLKTNKFYDVRELLTRSIPCK